MNKVIENIITRRSCKKYKSDSVPAEIIEQVIKAGLYAASGMGKQSPVIVAVTDKSIRDELSKLNSKYDPQNRSDPFYGAPVVLAVLSPRSVPTSIYDGSLVLGNMMLAAHSLGLGSCWIHRAKEVFEDEDGRKILTKLGIAENYEGIGNCILGYPDYELPKDMPRKENRVFRI